MPTPTPTPTSKGKSLYLAEPDPHALTAVLPPLAHHRKQLVKLHTWSRSGWRFTLYRTPHNHALLRATRRHYATRALRVLWFSMEDSQMRIFTVEQKRNAHDPRKAKISWTCDQPQQPGSFRGELAGRPFRVTLVNNGRKATDHNIPPSTIVEVRVCPDGDAPFISSTVYPDTIRASQKNIRHFIRQTVANSMDRP